MDLTDEQWERIEPHIPKVTRRADGRGRPRRAEREVMNGIMWIMRTGAQWKEIPQPKYRSGSTCHLRFQTWVRLGVIEKILSALAEDLKERGKLDLSECFIDGTFVSAKKGGNPWARPSGAKAAKSWQLQTALAFLSPFTYRLLRRMKSPSLNQQFQTVLSRMNPNGSSETKLTTATDMMRFSPNEALS